jgi:hypothetical protein
MQHTFVRGDKGMNAKCCTESLEGAGHVSGGGKKYWRVVFGQQAVDSVGMGNTLVRSRRPADWLWMRCVWISLAEELCVIGTTPLLDTAKCLWYILVYAAVWLCVTWGHLLPWYWHVISEYPATCYIDIPLDLCLGHTLFKFRHVFWVWQCVDFPESLRAVAGFCLK